MHVASTTALRRRSAPTARRTRSRRSARAEPQPANDEPLLYTDYLNHFNEVVMLIEMVPSLPEAAADILAWRPRRYLDHFEQSRLRDRDAAIAAYFACSDARRHALDAVVAELDTTIATAQSLLRGTADAGPRPDLAHLGAHLRQLAARASTVINGTSEEVAGGALGNSDAADRAMLGDAGEL